MSVIQLVRRTGLVVALLAAMASAGSAQGSTTTGAIRGRVIDEASNPLPAATVVATNEETGFQRGTQTDDQGVYVVRFLPPGTYRVAARRIGQEPADLPGVRVTVGSTTPANFTLRSAAVQLVGVEVRANAKEIDVADGGVKQTVSLEEISQLPSLGRDFTDFITLSGLVSPSPEVTTGGQFSIGGQRPSQTSIQIDGVDANNAFFGENRGGSRIPFAFSLESIREFQVVTNGFDVEFGNYSGGVINIVTQGGTNDFKASVYGNHRGKDLTRDDFDGNPPNNFSAQQYAGSVSGPIQRDRLHYFVSIDGQRRREPSRSTSVAFLRGSDDPADLAAADSLERFFDILESQYGVANAAGQYGEWETRNDVVTLFGRIDWTLNDRHRLSIRNNFSDHKNINEGGGFQSGRSQAEAFKDRANSLVGELTSVVRPSIFNVLRFQWATEERPRVGNNLKPELLVRTAPNETMEFGGSFLAFRNFLEENKFQIVDNVTVALGGHSLKFGTNNTFSSIQNIFWLNGSGGFEFNSLADFEAFRPSRFNRNVRVDSVAPNATFDVQEYSFYGQDEWQITPKLVGVFGARYDIQRYGDRPGRVVDVERALGIETGIAPIDDNNISPRVQLTYNVRGDATDVIRVGAGLFYGRVPFVMGSNVGITDTPLLVVDCRGSLAENAADAPPRPNDYRTWNPSGDDNPFTCGGVGGLGGVPEYTFWHRGFELPETLKANVGYERQIREGTTASVDLVFSESSKLYTVRNLNLRDPQFELASEGGRRIFVPAGRFTPNPTSGAGADRLRNTDFSNVYVNYNDGVARAFQTTVNFEQRLGDSASVRASYTYSWAYDNSTYSCCTANEGYRDGRYGIFGPNVVGDIGDETAGWGPSDRNRDHSIVLSGTFVLPFGIRLSPKWSIRSGTPWGPEVNGDINADGERFNDRPYIYRPEELPVFVPGGVPRADSLTIVATERTRYADYLEEFSCVGDYVGQIIPRNTCRQPWFNQLDLTLRKKFPTAGDQAVEVNLDLFNVMNGLNRKWGRNVSVTTTRRNLLTPQQFNTTTGQIEYTVPTTFGDRRQVGTALLMQFSAQIGVRYFF